MPLSGNVVLPIEEAVLHFDSIAGVIYLNNEYDENEETTHGNPYAYRAAYTDAKCWLCDALPLDNELQPFEGYECPVPIHTENFGEAIDYDGCDC